MTDEKYRHEYVNDGVSVIIDVEDNVELTTETITNRLNWYDKQLHMEITDCKNAKESRDWWRDEAVKCLKIIRRELLPLIDDEKVRELNKEMGIVTIKGSDNGCEH